MVLLLDPESGATLNAPLSTRYIIFWKTADASNSHIRSMVVPKSLYIATGNEIIDVFQPALITLIPPAPPSTFLAAVTGLCGDPLLVNEVKSIFF